MKTIRRTLHPEVRIVDAKTGLAEYVASDETLDSYREIIRASGWRFDHFEKNAPFVDSHDYWTIEKQLGKVVSFEVVGKKLVEVVQWAVDVAENKLAQLGWKMTEGGYLKAVSVGFQPVKWLSSFAAQTAERPLWLEQLTELGLDEKTANVRTIYTEQQQLELSACIIGANPNALARSYKAGVLTDADLDFLSTEATKRETASPAADPAEAALARQRARTAFLVELQKIIHKL